MCLSFDTSPLYAMNIRRASYEILQILSLTLLNKTQLNQLFDDAYLQTVKELEHKQLNMFPNLFWSQFYNPALLSNYNYI